MTVMLLMVWWRRPLSQQQQQVIKLYLALVEADKKLLGQIIQLAKLITKFYSNHYDSSIIGLVWLLNTKWLDNNSNFSVQCRSELAILMG